MAEAYIVEAVRTPVGRRGGGLSRGAPGGSRRARAAGARGARRTSTRGRRRRDLRLRRPGGRAGPRRRPHRLAGRRAAGERARRHDRPAVRLVAAGGAVRRRRPCMAGIHDLVVAGGVEVMSLVPICARDAVARSSGFGEPFRGRRLARALRGPGDLAVPRRRADRRAVGHLAARRWRSSPSRATSARSRAIGRGPLRPRDRRRYGGVTRRRGPARATPRSRRWRALKTLQRGRPDDRGGRRARSPTAPRRC